MDPNTLAPLDPTGRFSDRAADYVKYRPSYPAPVVDAILAGLPLSRGLRAADIGAGTGISARLLADRGLSVIAVEPNRAMREAAAPDPRIEWREGTAEATGLADDSLYLVLCAQSFHWFHAERAVAEFGRVLVRGGRLALVWNRRDGSDPLTAGYRQAILEVGGETSAERMEFAPEVVARSGPFAPIGRQEFRNFQRLDLDGLIGRARSASYVPKQGPASERLLELLRELHARYADANGYVTLVYAADVHLWERR